MGGKTGSGGGSCYQESGREGWTAKLRLRNGSTVKGRFATYEEARDTLAGWKVDDRRGLVVQSRTTVTEVLERWLVECIEPYRKPGTLETYQQHVRHHITPALGHHRVSDLTLTHVQALLSRLTADGLAPATVGLTRKTLRAALQQAVVWGLVPRNVATIGLRLPKVEQKQIDGLDPAEAKELLQILSHHRLSALYVLSLATGARISELCGLRWEDYDERTGHLHIRRQTQKVAGRSITDLPKGDGVRKIALAEWVKAEIAAHRTRQTAERATFPAGYDPGLMFTNMQGRTLSRVVAYNTLQQCLTRNGYERFSLHTLRHYAASLLLALGADMFQVSQTLGHKNISVTSRVYAHLTDSSRDDIARKMEALG